MSTNLSVRGCTVTLPKRTRKNVQQSKGGCFTCRARRKKCGEEKPQCKRCLQAGITCEGYPQLKEVLSVHRGTLSSIRNDHSSPPAQLYRGPSNPGQSRLFTLGLELLFQESRSSTMLIGSELWAYTVPQMAATNDIVHATITSLGAMYEVNMLRTATSNYIDQCRAGRHYENALGMLRSSLKDSSTLLIPLFFASVILAAVEVMQNRIENAAIHISGAFGLLQQHQSVNSRNLHNFQATARSDTMESDSSVAKTDSEVYAFAQALDVQIAAFALGTPPALMLPSAMTTLSEKRDTFHRDFTNSLRTKTLELIHSCLHFTSLASAYKYIVSDMIPPEMLTQQYQHVAQLLQCLSLLKQHHKQTAEKTLLALQINCLSTAIYTSTVLSAYETDYDAYMPLFRDITVIANAIASWPSSDVLAAPRNKFHILTSLAQPLYFTAVKCRDLNLRQEAIRLLNLTGREGPWNPPVHIAIAQRIIESEEMLSAELRVTTEWPLDNPKHPILERARICGSGFKQEAGSTLRPPTINVTLSRCIDVARMLSNSRIAWDASANWEIWSETVAVKYADNAHGNSI